MTATTSPDSPSSRPSHGARRAAAGLAAAALLLAACGSSHPSAKSSSSATSTTGSSTATGAPIAGGTVTFAEGPSTPPNYIFPLISAQHSSYANISQFQVLMYRPFLDTQRN
jgi:peptide/nickel transport system substrate-binding protein